MREEVQKNVIVSTRKYVSFILNNKKVVKDSNPKKSLIHRSYWAIQIRRFVLSLYRNLTLTNRNVSA